MKNPATQTIPNLALTATKPKGHIGRALSELGLTVRPIEEDEGNVDRYIISKRLVVERRTGSGFLQGILDKTLFTSAIYLREHFAMPVLIVEGQVNYEYRGFDPQAVRGALSSMMLEYGINVLSTPDPEETVALLTMLTRQEQVGIPEISLVPKRKAIDTADLQRRVVEMLPGCGRVMARDLLQWFGSVRAVINATASELRAVHGVGAKKAKDIVQVTGTEYGAVDTERDLEDALQAESHLLFTQPVALLARQHYIYTEAGERRFVDMVYLDSEANALVLVELKRGRLGHEHCRQLRRYLDHAADSPLLNGYIKEGTALRGILATVEPCALKVDDTDISVHIIDRDATIAVLNRMRKARLGRAARLGSPKSSPATVRATTRHRHEPTDGGRSSAEPRR